MKKRSMLILPLLGSLVLLSGCSGDIATAAADAAACRALQETLTGLSSAYQAGLVDSGVISHVDSLIGEQVRSLLSSSFAQDLKNLGDTMKSSDSAEATSQKISDLTNSLAERCSAVGVSFTN